jgi:uncharacterized repeat protein (TIGR03803 family)
MMLGLGGASARAAVHYQRLKSFGFPDPGETPLAPLLQATDGAFYGTTYSGGAHNGGVVFRVNPDGTGYSVLHSFLIDGFDGFNPEAALVEASDGALYGTTYRGGTNAAGAVFRLNKDGTGYSVLYAFLNDGVDASYPHAGLVEGTNGALYGTTPSGGTNGFGTVFRLNKDGSSYHVVYSFGATSTDASNPEAPLIRGTDGVLYGTTASGGIYTNQNPSGAGTVFKLNQDGSGYLILLSFGATATDGQSPMAPLVEGSDGALYGTTAFGGPNTVTGTFGTVFRLTRDGSNYNPLFSFPPYTSERGPLPERGPWLIQGNDGSLYGTSYFGGSESNSLGTVFMLKTDGSSYTVLHNFLSGGTDGAGPLGGPVQATDGALYGTTTSGGTDGLGTVFKLNKDGSNYGLLRSFFQVGPDGENTYAGLVLGPDGALYGTTYAGGTNGSGTLFRHNPDGSAYTILHSFTGAQGSAPYGGLLLGSDGMLYGTTSSGGPAAGGTVFQITLDGTGYNILHNFSNGGGDGNFPVAAMTEGTDGFLYGTTLDGGTNGAGTVFKLAKDGSTYTILYSFLGSTNGDGSGPNGGLIEATNGALYGTTWFGGSNNYGTVFSLGRDGSGYHALHRFKSSPTDGGNPFAGLFQASDGTLYGTTENGGTNGGGGTLFKLNTDGTGYRTLYSFNGHFGRSPEASPIEGPDGALYGTTSGGGTNNLGTVFRLNKDGTAYTVLYNFTRRGGDGESPFSGLAVGSDGAFYGTTDGGGDIGVGTVFKIWPPETPDLISATNGPNGIYVSFAGVSGDLYQLLRSTNLTSWTLLTNDFMPSGGTYTFFDKAPPIPTGYYRAAWFP